MDEGSEAGTERLLFFCASLRQHWAVRPLIPQGQCSVVEPCSSQVQDKYGLAHVFAKPSYQFFMGILSGKSWQLSILTQQAWQISTSII